MAAGSKSVFFCLCSCHRLYSKLSRARHLIQHPFQHPTQSCLMCLYLEVVGSTSIIQHPTRCWTQSCLMFLYLGGEHKHHTSLSSTHQAFILHWCWIDAALVLDGYQTGAGPAPSGTHARIRHRAAMELPRPDIFVSCTADLKECFLFVEFTFPKFLSFEINLER